MELYNMLLHVAVLFWLLGQCCAQRALSSIGPAQGKASSSGQKLLVPLVRFA